MSVIPYLAAFWCGVFFGMFVMCMISLAKKGE